MFSILIGGEEGVAGFCQIDLLVPDVLDRILDVGWAVATRPVDGELHVEAHGGLTAGGALEVLKRHVKRRSLETAEVGLAVVEAENAFDLLGSGDSFSNAVNLRLEILLAADAA